MSRLVRLAMLSVHTRIVPMAQRRAEVLQWVDRAGREGAELVLLPELADHHRTQDAIDAHKQGKAAVLDKLALSFESPWLQQIAALARKHKMIVIPCVIHNDKQKFYDATIVFGPDGSVLGSYNKTHLAPGEERILDPGTHLDPISTPLGKLGLLICWDIHFPEITRVYELKGADMLLWSTMRHGPCQRDLYQSLLPSRCFAHCMPMGVSTFVAEDQLLNRLPMNSVILDSFGMTVAGPMQNDTSLVSGVVDLDIRPIITKEWNDPTILDYARYLQSHRRPELYGALTAPISKSTGEKP